MSKSVLCDGYLFACICMFYWTFNQQILVKKNEFWSALFLSLTCICKQAAAKRALAKLNGMKTHKHYNKCTKIPTFFESFSFCVVSHFLSRPYLLDDMIWYLHRNCLLYLIALVVVVFCCVYLLFCLCSFRLHAVATEIQRRYSHLFVYLFVCHCVLTYTCIVCSCTLRMNRVLTRTDSINKWILYCRNISIYLSILILYNIYIYIMVRPCILAHLRSIFKFKFMTSTERS